MQRRCVQQVPQLWSRREFETQSGNLQALKGEGKRVTVCSAVKICRSLAGREFGHSGFKDWTFALLTRDSSIGG
jgi:hypothetical protein